MGEPLQKRLKQTKVIDDPAMESMLNVMVAASHLNDCNERVAAAFGITRSQYNVLRILRGVYPEGHSRQEITRRMVERSPDVTRLIDRLEQSGYVERERTDIDRRLSIARITGKGLELLTIMDPAFNEVLRGIGERLTEADMRELSRLCEKLYDGPSSCEG